MNKRVFKSLRLAALLVLLGAAVVYVWPQVSPVVRAIAGEWDDTNFDIRSVEMSEIRSGGPPKDGIPSIDEPKFVSQSDAADWLHPREPVIALRVGETARAYPIQILTWHEIVNDTLGGTPVSVTFCPLCNASIAFARKHDGVVLDFGTTGRLRLSDMVMYDRQTQSWWQQFTGEAIVGDMTGEVLTQIPSQIIAFEDFTTLYPSGDVLSNDTGYSRDYGRNPYAGYDDINQSPFLFDGKIDNRLPPMERVLSVVDGDETLLFPFSAVADAPIISLEFVETPLVVFAHRNMRSPLDRSRIADSRDIPAAAAFDRRIDGRNLNFVYENGRVTDTETGSEWGATGLALNGPLKGKHLKQIDGGVHFAFAWLAFDPSAEIYRAN
ncbi:MAG: DUF3179 domain-containing protein [Pseudomonadota bacterium]